MSTYTLEDVIRPSRASVKPKPAKKAAKKGKGDVELPDYIAPEAKTPSERREWDRMSSRMEGFHTYFRSGFRQIFELSDGSFEKHGLTPRDFAGVIEDFLHHLEFHHGIEERHIFPVLRKRMPQFEDDHQEEHDTIHAGAHSALTAKYRENPSSYSPDELRKNLASWGPVLFYHLDAEVESLKPDVLRRYWTLEEVRRLPM
ncbi:hypothetical protein Rhopal_001348-T1 [Rhodotorula paludigena]|uniref:Hemerythrin-like domain-containing protein n=1 Tax=Rhodotorula paludigena TaxID=86838 RepID=A0AAV5GG85_9BASI|nr:hypothetical protein Rhopal_001348-T1 [Rhodotorula paludigena]